MSARATIRYTPLALRITSNQAAIFCSQSRFTISRLCWPQMIIKPLFPPPAGIFRHEFHELTRIDFVKIRGIRVRYFSPAAGIFASSQRDNRKLARHEVSGSRPPKIIRPGGTAENSLRPFRTDFIFQPNQTLRVWLISIVAPRPARDLPTGFPILRWCWPQMLIKPPFPPPAGVFCHRGTERPGKENFPLCVLCDSVVNFFWKIAITWRANDSVA